MLMSCVSIQTVQNCQLWCIIGWCGFVADWTNRINQRQVMWQDSDHKIKKDSIKFSGIPFMILGTRIMECCCGVARYRKKVTNHSKLLQFRSSIHDDYSCLVTAASSIFTTRHYASAVYAAIMCLYVCLTIMHQYCAKTAELKTMQIMPWLKRSSFLCQWSRQHFNVVTE